MTERSCQTCGHYWPAGKRTPLGREVFVPLCRKLRNEFGPVAATMARSIDYRHECGPDMKAWKPA